MHFPRSLILLFVALACIPQLTFAQEAAIEVKKDVFVKGTVIERTARHIDEVTGNIADLRVKLDSGEEINVTLGGQFADDKEGVRVGEKVVLVRQEAGGETGYYLADRYRLPWVVGIIAILIALAIVVGRKRGVTATFGLAASIGVLAFIVMPQLANSINPVLVTFLGGVAIATLTTFIAHGTARESWLILGSILAALTVGTIAALAATFFLQLSGMGSEEAVAITYGPLASMNLQGLLIAGVILGCLGVLDDVAATQVATIKELAATDPQLTRRQLYRRGMRVGREHVAALINTLFLAYAGAALPLLLVSKVNLELPLWAFLNAEAVAEEIVRTAVGSGALILAVPIATALSASYFGAKRGLLKKEHVV